MTFASSLNGTAWNAKEESVPWSSHFCTLDMLGVKYALKGTCNGEISSCETGKKISRNVEPLLHSLFSEDRLQGSVPVPSPPAPVPLPSGVQPGLRRQRTDLQQPVPSTMPEYGITIAFNIFH